MAGGKARPKKDKRLKVSGGAAVQAGKILSRGITTYKAGNNVSGMGTLYADCAGKIYFSRKKTPHGRERTFINIQPDA